MKYRTKVIVLLMAMVFVTTGISIGILYWYFERLMRDQMGSQVLSVAATTAAFLDGDLHKALKAPGDENSAAYVTLRDAIRRARDANRRLAYAITERYQGADAARAAQERFDTVPVRRELPDEIEEHAFTADNGSVHVPALLSDAFGLSRSEGRRLLAQGGVKLDGEPLDESGLDLPAERLDGVVLQVGRRRFRRLRRS